MNEVLKIIFTFFLTGVVGLWLSHKFQKKQMHSQLYYKRSELDVAALEKIIELIILLSSDRIFKTRQLIYSMQNNSIDEKLRSDYRACVSEWNKRLNYIFISLNNNNLYSLSNRFERDVHAKFRQTHTMIHLNLNSLINTGDFDYSKALNLVNQAYRNTNDITNKLTKVKMEMMEGIIYADSEPLSLENIDKASTYTLFLAIFYKSPHLLRVDRTSMYR